MKRFRGSRSVEQEGLGVFCAGCERSVCFYDVRSCTYASCPKYGDPDDMSTKIFTTSNARWFALSPAPRGKPRSERMTLYSLIKESPGITSAELEEKWKFESSSMRSRLKELLDKKFIELQRPADLFSGTETGRISGAHPNEANTPKGDQ